MSLQDTPEGIQDFLEGVNNTEADDWVRKNYLWMLYHGPYDHFSATNSLLPFYIPSASYLCGAEPDVSLDNCCLKDEEEN